MFILYHINLYIFKCNIWNAFSSIPRTLKDRIIILAFACEIDASNLLIFHLRWSSILRNKSDIIFVPLTCVMRKDFISIRYCKTGKSVGGGFT